MPGVAVIYLFEVIGIVRKSNTEYKIDDDGPRVRQYFYRLFNPFVYKLYLKCDVCFG